MTRKVKTMIPHKEIALSDVLPGFLWEATNEFGDITTLYLIVRIERTSWATTFECIHIKQYPELPNFKPASFTNWDVTNWPIYDSGKYKVIGMV